MKTRREFLLSISAFLAACTAQKEMSEEEKQKIRQQTEEYNKREAGKNLISEGHPIAATFKYRKDGTSASANLNKNNRYGVPPEEQLCRTCQFYTAIGSDYGSCQILPQGNVTANGWCMSWAKKGSSQDIDINNPPG